MIRYTMLAAIALATPVLAADDDAARKNDLVLANHILADQGVVDGFGHISVRSAANPGHMFIARSLAPELVTPADLLEVDIATCEPIGTSAKTYLERFIHCATYQARPDVQSVVHNHSPGLIPFGAAGQVLRPVYHMAGFLGAGAPVFEIRHAGGPATDMLIRTPALGKALAATLGAGNAVVMRGHGATLVGGSVRQAVYRAIYAEKDAALQAAAMRMGPVTYLNAQEALGADTTNNGQIDRPWALWVAHLRAP